RKRVDNAAAELIAVARHIFQHHPELAGVYGSLGKGLRGSHSLTSGAHHLVFDLPKDCVIAIEGESVQSMQGPIQVNIVMPGSDLMRKKPLRNP
ncbi:MAG: hypothetical protein JWM11_3887, partial [Planctomycetaceae bacterium]|nr:hypothetical protein [Planctomycetaceae bacterium]